MKPRHAVVRTIAVAAVLFLGGGVGMSAGEGQHRDDREATIVDGSVRDPSGAAVAAAQVMLTLTDGTQSRTVMSGIDGRFTFAGVAPGSYVVTVRAHGFAPFATSPFTLTSPRA